MISVLEKQWVDSSGTVLNQFLYLINPAEAETKVYLEQEPRPILPKNYYDANLTVHEMLLNFRQSKHQLDWIKMDTSQLIFEKFVKNEVNGCCHRHSNSLLKCRNCDQYHTCCHCGCGNFVFQGEIKCIQCNLMQKTQAHCQGCSLQLGDSVCEICGVWFEPNAAEIHHCGKCGFCHNIKHQYCIECKKCFPRQLFLELHCHKPTAVVCSFCKEPVVTDAMRYKKLECGCICCFLCACKHVNEKCEHNCVIEVEDGTWGDFK